MPEPIDHAAEALNRINSDDPVDEITALRFAKAQVHATLALVEQQRIANLIALGVKWLGPNGLWVPTNPGMPDGNMTLNADISKALGLEQTND